MTIPVYVVGAASLVTIVYLYEKFEKRGLVIMGCCVHVAIGYLVCVATPNPHAGYAGMFILVLGKSVPNSKVLIAMLIAGTRHLPHLYSGRRLGCYDPLAR